MATWLLEPEFERYEETKERKLVFAAHDPSARNHLADLGSMLGSSPRAA